MERITSARGLTAHLVEQFRRDGVFRGPRFVDKDELILPMGPEFERSCAVAAALRQKYDKAATLSRHDSDNVADFADELACRYKSALLFGHTVDSAADMIVGLIPKQQELRATYVPVDFATFANRLNHSDDDWRELSENALNDERKANRARERALKRSRRNTKNPKKKGKLR